MKSFIKSHRLSLSFDRFGDSDQDSRYELFPELLGSGDSKYASTHQSRDRNIQPSSSRRFSEYHVRSKHNPDLSSPHSPTSPSSYSLKKFNPISYIRKRCSSEEYKRSSYIPSVEEYKEAGAIFGTRVHNWDSRNSTSNTTDLGVDANLACRHLEQAPNPGASTDLSSNYSLHLAPTNFSVKFNLSDTDISSDQIAISKATNKLAEEKKKNISSTLAKINDNNESLSETKDLQNLQNLPKDYNLTSTSHGTTEKTVIQAQNFHGLGIKNQKVKSSTTQNFDDPVQKINLFLRQSLVLNSDDDLNSSFDKSSIASPKTPNITPALVFEKRSISNGSTIDTFITANSPSFATNDASSFKDFGDAIDNEDTHSEFSFEEDITTGRTSSFKFYSSSPSTLQVYPGPSAKHPRGPISHVSKFPSVKFNSAGKGFQNNSQFCTNGSDWDPNEIIDLPVAPLKWTYSCDDLTENKTSTTSFSSRYVTKSCSNLHIDSDDTSNYDYDVFLDEVNADDDYSMEFHDASSYCNELNYQDSIISRQSRSSSRYFHSSRIIDLKRQHSVSRKSEYNATSLHAHKKSNKVPKLSQPRDISRRSFSSTNDTITGEFGLTELEENIYCSIMQNLAPPAQTTNESCC